MKPIAQDVPADEAIQVALLKVQVFLAIVLAEHTGPLTILQRDMLESAKVAAIRAEHLLAELVEVTGPPP
jgi:hypothetical protein